MTRIAIMAHPTRLAAAGDLAAKVLADSIALDIGGGENENGDRAWSSLAGADTDWSVVLQDDAIPVEFFLPALDAALEAAGNSLVSLYVGTDRPRDREVAYATEIANATDASWLVCDSLLWGVGVAMPTKMIEGYLSWTETNMIGTDDLYDRRLGMWARRAGLQIKYTWPSLVDHADGYSLAAEANGMTQPRRPRVARRVGVRGSYDGASVRIPRKREPLPGTHLSQSL